MRTVFCAFSTAALFALLVAAPSRAEGPSLVILFGPTSESSGQPAARAVADMAQVWLQSGADVELRRAGVAEGQEFGRKVQPADLETALLDAARGARQGGLLNFLNALDKAAYALARRPEKRVLLIVVDGLAPAAVAALPGGAAELESRLNQATDFCRSHRERVVVFAPSGAAATTAPFQNLAASTAGSFSADTSAFI